MPSASDTQTPALAPAAKPQRQEPVLRQTPHSGTGPGSTNPASPLPASIAGAFAAAAYSLQNSLQSTEMPEEDAGLLPQLYASRIGPRAQAYYLAQFKRFDALDRSLPSWNMAAAFFTLAWCCLRGLWLEAAKYLAAVTVVALIWWMGLRPALPHAMALGVGAALWLVAMAVPGLLANGWYWRKIKAETLQAITAAPNMAQAHAELQAQASPAQNKVAALLVLALPVAAIAGASLALLPSRNTPPAIAEQPVVQPVAAPAVSSVVASVTAPVIEPGAPAQPAESVSEPVTAPVPAAIAAPVDAATPASAKAEAPENSAKAAPAKPQKADAAPTPANTNTTATDLIPGKFYLNVGVYSEAANADKVLAQLHKSKLPALAQKMTSNKGEVTRLRSGPFESRKRAERALRKLQAANIDATVFQPADKTAKP
ncbi:SPOR domain-containing protein [Comamonas suwonensis]|uniref:SPOR domain-containing protein n=1 Tax=Comamonas suwonensis TaxID=2606214 RepID=UPI00145F25C0|nr:SPOR domain-containing protein [Comamonas suwonensis]MBI1625129.1 SPOR domain-containing protein [Comamonas suwonensis]